MRTDERGQGEDDLLQKLEESILGWGHGGRAGEVRSGVLLFTAMVAGFPRDLHPKTLGRGAPPLNPDHFLGRISPPFAQECSTVADS